MKGEVRRVDVSHPQHNDRRYIFSVFGTDGLAQNITGVSEIVWSIARSPKSTKLLTKTLTGGGVVLTSTNKFYIDVSVAEINALDVKTYYHDALITTATGAKRTPFAGQFVVVDTLAGDA